MDFVSPVFCVLAFLVPLFRAEAAAAHKVPEVARKTPSQKPNISKPMKQRRIFSAVRLSFPLAAALVAMLSTPAVHAGQIWDGGGADNNWNTAANWDSNTLPTFTNAITFAGAGDKECHSRSLLRLRNRRRRQ